MMKTLKVASGVLCGIGAALETIWFLDEVDEVKEAKDKKSKAKHIGLCVWYGAGAIGYALTMTRLIRKDN